MEPTDIQKLLDTINQFTQKDQPGINRLTLTPEDKAARDFLKDYMLNMGLRVHVDRIGNMIGIRPGKMNLPAIAMGSHLDSVKHGGAFDGPVGIIAGLAVVEYLNKHRIETKHPIAVINFTNEEGVRFTPDMMGSYVYSGKGKLEEMYQSRDIDHPEITLAMALDEIGYLGDTEVGDLPLSAFIELHIEQGKILEMEQLEIGIVEKVQGIYWTAYEFQGESNHAGTTPMHIRRDAGYAAAKLATFSKEIADDIGAPQVLTAGRIEFSPNVTNIVPGTATVTIDNRFPEIQQINQTQLRLDSYATQLAAENNLALKIEPLVRFAPVDFDQVVIAHLESSAKELQVLYKKMISGAGHDAQMIALTYPAAMVFVPSKNGISHNPKEFTEIKHIVQAIELIRKTVMKLDQM